MSYNIEGNKCPNWRWRIQIFMFICVFFSREWSTKVGGASAKQYTSVENMRGSGVGPGGGASGKLDMRQGSLAHGKTPVRSW